MINAQVWGRGGSSSSMDNDDDCYSYSHHSHSSFDSCSGGGGGGLVLGLEEVTEVEAINIHSSLAMTAADHRDDRGGGRMTGLVRPAPDLEPPSLSDRPPSPRINTNLAVAPRTAKAITFTADADDISLSGSDHRDEEDGHHHSLPAPEPRRRHKLNGTHERRRDREIVRRRIIIWSVAAVLIVGVIGAFVGGYLAGETRGEGKEMMLEMTMGGDGDGGAVEREKSVDRSATEAYSSVTDADTDANAYDGGDTVGFGYEVWEEGEEEDTVGDGYEVWDTETEGSDIGMGDTTTSDIGSDENDVWEEEWNLLGGRDEEDTVGDGFEVWENGGERN